MTAVLRLLGGTLVGLLVLLLLLLLLPVTVDLLYEKGVLTAGVRVLGVRIPLLPKRREKSRKQAAADEGDAARTTAPAGEAAAEPNAQAEPAAQSAGSGQAASTPKGQAETAPDGQTQPAAPSAQPEPAEQTAPADDAAGTLSSRFAQFQAAFNPAKRWVKWLFAHMRLREFVFVFNVRSADPAQLGVECGILWILVGKILWFLGLLFGERLQVREVTVYPCFHPQDGARERFGFHLTAAPIIIGIAAAGFYLQWQRNKRNCFARQGATIEDGN